MSCGGAFGKVALPVDFRHRQTKPSLPPRAFSVLVQQMRLLRQTPGGNTLPPRHVDLHLRIATDGKDRCVSRQARQAGLEALSAGLSCLWRGVLLGSWPLYIDNGGCSLERRHPCRAAACQPVWQSLVPDHPSGLGTPPCCGLFAKPGENSRFVALARVQRSCRGRPSGSAPGAAFVIHWIHVSIFFPQQNVRRT